MRCPHCHADNRPEAQFCHDCGRRLTLAKKPSPKQPKRQYNHRTFWLAVLAVLGLIVVGICGLTGWMMWRSYSESLTQTAGSGTPPSIEAKPAPVLTLPIPTEPLLPTPTASPVLADHTEELSPDPTIKTEITPVSSNERIIYASLGERGFTSLASVLPDGNAKQIINLPLGFMESNRELSWFIATPTRFLSPNEKFIKFTEYVENSASGMERAGLWLINVDQGKAELMPQSKGVWDFSDYGSDFSPNSKLLY